MDYNQFKNLSCYEEFEMKCILAGISKIDALNKNGYMTGSSYFFISKDGIFNWFDLEGNHIEDPGNLIWLSEAYIPKNIDRCIIPDSVTYITNYAFYCCKSLKEITIPDNVICIDNYVFAHCDSLTSISMADSVIRIGYGAFYGCKSLTSITIPDNVTNIGQCVFSYCDSLKEVIFKGKTLEEIKQMKSYPFGIEDESKIKCER